MQVLPLCELTIDNVVSLTFQAGSSLVSWSKTVVIMALDTMQTTVLVASFVVMQVTLLMVINKK